MAKSDATQPIIFKKIKKAAAGHHGGAWKVAYADFVTAMMAFFLLLWLLNVATDVQKEAISNYFDPSDPRIAQSLSGAGGIMGGLSVAKDGAMVSQKMPIVHPAEPERKTPDVDKIKNADPNQQNPSGRSKDSPSSGGKTASKKKDPKELKAEKLEKIKERIRSRENRQFTRAEKSIDQALQKTPELKELSKHMMVDVTPEGLRIQIVDEEGKPMFALGKAQMFEQTKALMGIVAEAVRSLPNKISLRGHTDSYAYAPGAAYTNWELSADRANASRRVLTELGVPEDRFENVVGKADTEPLVPDDPLSPRNRRISILILREDVPNADSPEADAFLKAQGEDVPADEATEEDTSADAESDETDDEAVDGEDATPAESPVPFQPTPGKIYFP